MRRPVLLLLGLSCAFSGLPPANQARPSDVPVSAANVLTSIRQKDREQYAVSEEDGRLLRILAGARSVRHALEIGAASGYSAIWIGLALRETGGELTTIESDDARAHEARANIERAGLAKTIRVISGDAFAEIPKLPGTFDFVFLDAWKRDYLKFFALTFPRVEPGGLFVAHNVVNKRDEMKDFLAVVLGRPDAWTTIVSPSGEGLSLTYKRR